MDGDPVVKAILIAIMFVLLGSGATLLIRGIVGLFQRTPVHAKKSEQPEAHEAQAETQSDEHRRAA
jgi:hypothetical protein